MFLFCSFVTAWGASVFLICIILKRGTCIKLYSICTLRKPLCKNWDQLWHLTIDIKQLLKTNGISTTVDLNFTKLVFWEYTKSDKNTNKYESFLQNEEKGKQYGCCFFFKLTWWSYSILTFNLLQTARDRKRMKTEHTKYVESRLSVFWAVWVKRSCCVRLMLLHKYSRIMTVLLLLFFILSLLHSYKILFNFISLPFLYDFSYSLPFVDDFRCSVWWIFGWIFFAIRTT